MSDSMINNQQQFNKSVDLFVSKFANKHEKPLSYYLKQFYGIVIPIIVMKVQKAVFFISIEINSPSNISSKTSRIVKCNYHLISFS